MNKSLSYHHYYQIVSPVMSTQYRSKSSDSISHTTNQKSESPQKQLNKKSKIKKSQAALVDLQGKPSETAFNSASILRRRFSLFRSKRCSQSDEPSTVQTLQQHHIDQLKHDLHIKTTELEEMKEYIKNKRSNMGQLSSESVEQTRHIQLMLNGKLEEMLKENDLLKKSIQELESLVQHQRRK